MSDPINRISDIMRQRLAPAAAPAADLNARRLEEVVVAALLDDGTSDHLEEIGAPTILNVDAFRSVGMEQHGTGCKIEMYDGSVYAVTIRRIRD